ncbi:MAG: Cof-type HAD-IIB family hydrolase [Treponema sp.]|jgi:Cof subfamily protein (haloacid dehalogenase superfamily)|nr:Cof-type HAD-IIB family hydrolase [Treponema sp.]
MASLVPLSYDFSRIKALALDLDGTLLRPDNVLSDLTVNTLRACRDRGLRLIICTGRSPEASEAYRAAMGATGPMVFFNGAEVTDVDERGGRSNTVYALLHFDVIERCVDIARKTGVYFQVYFPETSGAGKRLVAERKGAEGDAYFKHTGSLSAIEDIRETLADAASRAISGCIKGMFIADPDTLDEIRPLLAERLGDTVSLTKTFSAFLEVMPTGVSKGTGLTLALERLSLTGEAVIAAGDEESDISMFAIAGFSAAPANAKDHVKAAAHTVIRANTEDGVARFLDQHVLHAG